MLVTICLFDHGVYLVFCLSDCSVCLVAACLIVVSAWYLPDCGVCLSDGGVFLVSGTLTRCLESLEGQADSPEEAKTTDALKQVCHHNLIVTLGPYSSLLGMLGIMQGLSWYIYMGHSPENWSKEGASFPMK